MCPLSILFVSFVSYTVTVIIMISVSKKSMKSASSDFIASLDKTRTTDFQRYKSEIQIQKPIEKYCTGSTYEGNYNLLGGFSGFGTYIFPHGAKYQGRFWDGEFHGDGTITYPQGQQLHGTWNRGKLVEHVHEFADGLEYDKNLDYCQFPDRTFQHERINGLQAPSKEYLTNQQPTKDIPANCYDTVEGYYDPQTKIVYKKDNKILNVVTAEEEQTMKQYRKVPDGPVGFMAGLYEFWTIGKKKEMKQIEELYAHDNKTKTTTTSPAPESETSLLYSYWG